MNKHKIQKGIFSFLNGRNLSIHEMRSVLNMYANSIGEKRPRNHRLEWYVKISNLANTDFTNFNKIYNENKTTFNKSNSSYDEWYQESSMDGTFAYNGVADDF